MKNKNDNYFHRKATMDRLFRVWNNMPELTLAEMIWRSNNLKMLETMSDEQIVQNCKNHIRVYKEERSLKNKIKKGLKSCVTKMTIW